MQNSIDQSPDRRWQSCSGLRRQVEVSKKKQFSGGKQGQTPGMETQKHCDLKVMTGKKSNLLMKPILQFMVEAER